MPSDLYMYLLHYLMNCRRKARSSWLGMRFYHQLPSLHSRKNASKAIPIVRGVLLLPQSVISLLVQASRTSSEHVD